MKHTPVRGDHSACGPDCAITGDLCCGGHQYGVCGKCDSIRDAAPELLAALEAHEFINPTQTGQAVIAKAKGEA